MQADRRELRVHHDVIIRQSGIANQLALDSAAYGSRRVDEIGQVTDVTIREPDIWRRQSSQRLGTGQSRPVHNPDASNIEVSQHLIEQRSRASSAGHIERLKDAILKDVHLVEIYRRPQLRPFRAAVADI